MGVSLSKGGNVSLAKEDPSLTALKVALGWDGRSTDGAPFDLDASLFRVTATGKVATDKDFIFYGNLKSDDGSIEHMGDNRTGAAAGDDEVILVNLSKVPMDIEKLVVAVTIHEADVRKQNFGMVMNAFIRLDNDQTGVEVVRFDLTEDMSTETAMVFGEVYRDKTNPTQWKFRAVAQGFAGGLAPLATGYGVNIA
jgi:tellurium resistance protein TerD